jgi:hypothetical protein
MVPPGRFLRKNPDTGVFHEVSEKEAREKVCQTLRDAVGDANAARDTNAAGGSSSHDDEPDNDEEDDDDDQMPLLPIEEEMIENYEYNPFSTKMLPLENRSSVTSTNISISPDKVTSSMFNTAATVTPTNQVIEPTPSFTHVTSSNQTDLSPSLFDMEYDAYNYLSRVSINDDFDLFDGELLKAAMHDEVFASMRLSD